MHLALFRGNEAVARMLIERGASVNAATARGKTPLHYAAQACLPDIIQLLLDKGADPEVKSTVGRTPKDMALMAFCYPATRLLMREGDFAKVDTTRHAVPEVDDDAEIDEERPKELPAQKLLEEEIAKDWQDLPYFRKLEQK